ncbi:MAG: hypothetical protein ACRDP8_12765, partial [Actinopolymorphaceae bacterium]
MASGHLPGDLLDAGELHRVEEDDHSVVVGSGSVDRRPSMVYVSDLGVGNSQQLAEDEFVQDLG